MITMKNIDFLNRHVIISAFILVHVVLKSRGNLVCDKLSVEDCAFAVDSSGARCVLEKKHIGNDLDVKYGCQTSTIMAERGFEGIETDDCIRACGLRRQWIGLSTDPLMEPSFLQRICSSTCGDNCPNITDLFSTLLAEEGFILPHFCDLVDDMSKEVSTATNDVVISRRGLEDWKDFPLMKESLIGYDELESESQSTNPSTLPAQSSLIYPHQKIETHYPYNTETQYAYDITVDTPSEYAEPPNSYGNMVPSCTPSSTPYESAVSPSFDITPYPSTGPPYPNWEIQPPYPYAQPPYVDGNANPPYPYWTAGSPSPESYGRPYPYTDPPYPYDNANPPYPYWQMQSPNSYDGMQPPLPQPMSPSSFTQPPYSYDMGPSTPGNGTNPPLENGSPFIFPEPPNLEPSYLPPYSVESPYYQESPPTYGESPYGQPPLENGSPIIFPEPPNLEPSYLPPYSVESPYYQGSLPTYGESPYEQPPSPYGESPYQEPSYIHGESPYPQPPYAYGQSPYQEPTSGYIESPHTQPPSISIGFSPFPAEGPAYIQPEPTLMVPSLSPFNVDGYP